MSAHAEGPYFRPAFFEFLRDIGTHNERPWFEANRARYETDVRDASLRFVRDLGPQVARFSRQLVADARPSGGSITRIFRDTRFAKDKSPYKNYVGIHFFHRATDEHEGSLPGFYMHLSPDECMVASGMWRPETAEAGKIRSAIARNGAAWKKVAASAALSKEGDRLKRVPAPFDPASPWADDLRRKDFVASRPLTRAQVTSAQFPKTFLAACAELDPLNGFLAKAIGLPY